MQEGGHSFARRLHQATDSLADAAFLARMNGSASREDIKGSYSKNGRHDSTWATNDVVAEYLRRQAPAGAVLCLEARKAETAQALLRHGWKAEAVVAVTDNRFDYLCLLETGTTRRPELQPMRVHCGKVETLFDSLGGVEDAPAPSSSSAAASAAASSSSSSVQAAAPTNDPRAGGLAAAYLDPGCQPCALERLVVHALRSRAFREGAVVAFQPSLAHLPPRLQAKALLQLEEEVVAVAKQSGYSADRLVRVTQAPTYVLHLGSWRQPPPAPARPAAAGAAAAAAPGAAAAGAAGPTKRRSSPGSPPQQLERRRESSFLLPNRLTEAAWAPSLGLLGAEGLHKGPPARRRLPGQYDTRR